MGIGVRAVFTLSGIALIGWILASFTPPQWVAAELFLLIACVVLIREYMTAEARTVPIDRSQDRVAANGWFAGVVPGSREASHQVFHPWDFDQPAAKPRPATQGVLVVPQIQQRRRPSVEQIAHEMLDQAFRQAARQHHPDHGGDPEDMRRVYAARELILRAIHRPS